MSEKKLRKDAEHRWWCISRGTYRPADCNCGLREALADEPDVVRLALEFLEDETVESSSGERYISLSVERLHELLGAMFGIRLTDDGGWEWTDE